MKPNSGLMTVMESLSLGNQVLLTSTFNLKHNYTNTHNAERSDCPKFTIVLENMKKKSTK